MYEYYNSDGTFFTDSKTELPDITKPIENTPNIKTSDHFLSSTRQEDPLFLSCAGIEGGLYLNSLQNFAMIPEVREIVDKKCSFLSRGVVDIVKETIEVVLADRAMKKEVQDKKSELIVESSVIANGDHSSGSHRPFVDTSLDISIKNELLNPEIPSSSDIAAAESMNAKSFKNHSNTPEMPIASPLLNLSPNSANTQIFNNKRKTLHDASADESELKPEPSTIVEQKVDIIEARIFETECGKIDFNQILNRIANPFEYLVEESELILLRLMPLDVTGVILDPQHVNVNENQGPAEELVKRNIADFSLYFTGKNIRSVEENLEILSRIRLRISLLFLHEQKINLANQQNMQNWNQNAQIQRNDQRFRPAGLPQQMSPNIRGKFQMVGQRPGTYQQQNQNRPQVMQQQFLLQQLQQQQLQQHQFRANLNQGQQMPGQQLLNRPNKYPPQNINQFQAFQQMQHQMLVQQQQQQMMQQNSHQMQMNLMNQQVPQSLQQQQQQQQLLQLQQQQQMQQFKSTMLSQNTPQQLQQTMFAPASAPLMQPQSQLQQPMFMNSQASSMPMQQQNTSVLPIQQQIDPLQSQSQQINPNASMQQQMRSFQQQPTSMQLQQQQISSGVSKELQQQQLGSMSSMENQSIKQQMGNALNITNGSMSPIVTQQSFSNFQKQGIMPNVVKCMSCGNSMVQMYANDGLCANCQSNMNVR
jgi:hypothetical protein